MQTIYLDISNKGVVPTVYAKQGDIGRKFSVIFTDAGVPYIVPSGSAFSVWYDGSSGEGNYTDIDDHSAFIVDDNRVEVEMISQMLSVDGEGNICIVLMSDTGQQIASWNIPYICEKVPGFDSEEAKAYYTAFYKMIEEAKKITNAVLYTEQTLTEEQQAQARENIGVEGGGGGGGTLNVTDDGNGNVTVLNLTATDDGNGNVTFGGIV